MKGNSNYEKPAVDPVAMIDQSGVLDTAYNKRKNDFLGKETYKAEAVLAGTLDMMKTQAKYVSGMANGNLAIESLDFVASAGFTATATVASKKVVPQSPTLENVNGKLNLKLKRIKGADSYCYLVFIGELSDVTVTDNQIVINPKANVILLPSGTTRELVSGLASATKVFVMVLAQNSAGKSAFSLW